MMKMTLKKWIVRLLPFALGLVALAVRLLTLHTYDIHIDEITYEHFAKTIDQSGMPRDYAGNAFFLHPPGYFYLLSLWRLLFWHGTDIFQELYTMRILNVVLGSLTAIVIFYLAKRLTNKTVLASLVTLVFIFDPFIIRQNTRSLIETLTMLLFLIGTLLLVKHRERSAESRSFWLFLGFVFGLSVVTKDIIFVLLLLMIALCLFQNVGPAKRAYRYLIPAALLPYALWLLYIAATGYTSSFIHQKFLGVERFFGILQTTGFNAANAPSKSGTLLSTIPQYATSYLLMGLGAILSFHLLFARNRLHRLWGCVSTAATLILVYMYVGGTFEEQYLYYLLIPSMLTCVIAGFEAFQHNKTKRPRLTIWTTVGFLSLIISFNVATFVQAVPQKADGWQSAITWTYDNIPANSTICVYSQAQFLLQGHGYKICSYETARDFKAHQVSYALVSLKLSEANYEPLTNVELQQILLHSTEVYRYNSADSGTFLIVKINDSALPSSAVPVLTAKQSAAKSNHELLFVVLAGGLVIGLFMTFLIIRWRRYVAPHQRNSTTVAEHANRTILILNWRDTRHKQAGGAEVYAHELAKRWVKAGHTVYMFAGNDGASIRKQTIDGVQITRRGNFATVYIWAFLYYVLQYRHEVDIIIDSQNGIPFFSPLYSRKPIICVMHHVHQEIFKQYLPLPAAKFACALERYVMPFVYGNRTYVAVSESTKKDMTQSLQIAAHQIIIIHNGINIEQFGAAPKTAIPTILYLGRLKTYKSVDILLKAFAQIQRNMPAARLAIAGTGDDEARLRTLTTTLNLQQCVTFTGFISEKQKITMLQRAWVFCMPSRTEGWGITVIEANAAGTPVVASNVSGLKESVNAKTGFLVPYGDVDAFADKLLRILQDQILRKQLSAEAITWAGTFSWDGSAADFEKLFDKI